jgi:deoxyadenosine/deoxycytidine kinase
MMLDKARYIVVEGPIGAGKTSLAKRLAERLDATTCMEAPEQNAFLSRFYSDMARHALPTQIAFLLQRVDMLSALTAHDFDKQRVVSDFLLDKDPLFAAMNLDPAEHLLYQDLYRRLAPPVKKPDLVIYLQADPTTLMNRVRNRGLDAERRITTSYLARVADQYTSFFHEFTNCPLFVVDAQVLNPVDIPEDFELLIERLKAMRSYREFFGYAE